MNAKEREAAMDELDKLDERICKIECDLEECDNPRWAATIKSFLADVKHERNRVLRKFPEVEYAHPAPTHGNDA